MSSRSPDCSGVGAKLDKHQFSFELVWQMRLLSARRDNVHGPLALAEDLTIIGIGVLFFHVSPWLYLVSLMLIGTRQRALATLLHEGAHGTLCASRWLGMAIGMVAGWTVLQSFYRYWHSHAANHHPYLGDETRDPDAINYVRQGLYDGPARSFFLRQLIPLALGLKAWTNLSNVLRDRLIPTNFRSLSSPERTEYLLFLAFWIAVVTALAWIGHLGTFVLLWVVPYLTVFQAVNWLIELAEHFPLTRLSSRDLDCTRNRYGSAVENFFTGMHGENWHLVHHLFPAVPFWHLATAHRILLQDPLYATAAMANGGLLMTGANGAPSIISELQQQLADAQRPSAL